MKKISIAEEGLYIEKKSKFICHLFPVSNQDEIADILKAEKKKYFDARHHCYAYILGDDGNDYKCSDDGEPSGTAGRPMLEILQREGLTDILCVVTRYFGGTLLGTGGLVRAYSESLKDAIDKSTFISEEKAIKVKYSYAYNFDAKVSQYFREKSIRVLTSEYLDNVSSEIVVKEDDYKGINDDLVNITNGKISGSEPENCMFSF